MERHVPRLATLDRRAGRGSAKDRPQAGDERREDRRRRALHRTAPLLGGNDERSSERSGERSGYWSISTAHAGRQRMKTITTADLQAFLYREARLLDAEQWDEWLTCYHTDAVFWMPSWDDED